MLDITAETNMDALGVEPEHERGAFMSVYSGGKFYPLDPKPEEIFIEDIAHALSQQNRFNGHLRWPYTVAQHSVLCAKMAERNMHSDNTIFYTLLHDAAEAYIGDLIRPIKYYFEAFSKIEDTIMDVIAERFEFDITDIAKRDCKRIDNIMCAAEKRDLHPTELEWPGMEAPSYQEVPEITVWSSSYAKGQFMRMFNRLH